MNERLSNMEGAMDNVWKGDRRTIRTRIKRETRRGAQE